MPVPGNEVRAPSDAFFAAWLKARGKLAAACNAMSYRPCRLGRRPPSSAPPALRLTPTPQPTLAAALLQETGQASLPQVSNLTAQELRSLQHGVAGLLLPRVSWRRSPRAQPLRLPALPALRNLLRMALHGLASACLWACTVD